LFRVSTFLQMQELESLLAASLALHLNSHSFDEIKAELNLKYSSDENIKLIFV
jgi:hypothetical protein